MRPEIKLGIQPISITINTAAFELNKIIIECLNYIHIVEVTFSHLYDVINTITIFVVVVIIT